MHHRRTFGPVAVAVLSAAFLVPEARPGVLDELPPPQLSMPGVAGLVVWLESDCAVDEVLAITGPATFQSLNHGNVHVLEVKGTNEQLVDLKRRVSEAPFTVGTDWNRRVGVPEQSHCAPSGPVGAQQCTIAFVDGVPTAAEFGQQGAIVDVKASYAQNFSWPKPVVVAVIDTGIDPAHRVFFGGLAGFGWDYITNAPGAIDVRDGRDNDGDGDVDEAWGHGTHVAGTILALNRSALILPMRVLDADGIGTTFDLARAIVDAVDQGAEIINLSLSMVDPSLPVALALQHAWTRGVAVFTSAGNLGTDQVLFPGNMTLDQFPEMAALMSPEHAALFDPVVTVSSVDSHRVKSDFSSYGRPVDMVAPGEDIYSAFPGNRYARWSGTSMACAVASGAASLLLSNDDKAAPSHVVQAMAETGQSVDDKNPLYAGQLGSGRIHVWHATIELWKMLD